MLKLREGHEDGSCETRTILPTRESMAMAKRRQGELRVRVTCIHTPDGDIRIDRAVSLLLATAQQDEGSDNKHDSYNYNEGKDPGRSDCCEYQGDSTDTG